MAALTSNRSTAEILCHTMKLHRILPPTPDKRPFIGAIVALNCETGTVEPASNKRGLIVLGRCEGFTDDGRVITKTGTFKYDNVAEPTRRISLFDINQRCYIVDDHTVARASIHVEIGLSARSCEENLVCAGTIRDIDPEDGQVIVELGL